MVTPAAWAPSRRELLAALPPGCRRPAPARALATLLRDALVWLAVTAALVVVEQPLALPPLWLLGGLAIGALFVLGHDAGHGTLLRGTRANRVAGTLALLPSLHAWTPWLAGHDRLHHGHTARRAVDFVWHPLTSQEWSRLSRSARALHHLEWSPLGAGLYYLRAVWWARMLRLPAPPRLRGAFRRDRLVVAAAFVAWSAALVAAGWLRRGTVAGAAAAWASAFLAPWLVWNCLIGATVRLHHGTPGTRWRAGRVRGAPPLEATTTYRIPAWLDVFWHGIFLHGPHHLDPAIPFHRLAAAAAALGARFGDAYGARPLGLRDWWRTARACKLYDFERGTWLGYDGHPARSGAGDVRRG